MQQGRVLSNLATALGREPGAEHQKGGEPVDDDHARRIVMRLVGHI